MPDRSPGGTGLFCYKNRQPMRENRCAECGVRMFFGEYGRHCASGHKLLIQCWPDGPGDDSRRPTHLERIRAEDLLGQDTLPKLIAEYGGINVEHAHDGRLTFCAGSDLEVGLTEHGAGGKPAVALTS